MKLAAPFVSSFVCLRVKVGVVMTMFSITDDLLKIWTLFIVVENVFFCPHTTKKEVENQKEKFKTEFCFMKDVHFTNFTL